MRELKKKLQYLEMENDVLKNIATAGYISKSILL
ncbi:hypothetical protein Xenpb_01667 [Xenorhabdus sp. PB62.4]|nr:hypothetical protein [Xenorhabdus sp. PB62.4]